MADSDEKKSSNPFLLLLKLVLGIVALAAGFKYGFGPLLTYQAKRPSQVYVINGTDQAYHLSLGWRRIKKTLHPNSFCHFSLYVGMKETQKLSVTPESGGSPRQLPIPLEPDCLTLFNLDQATTFYAYRPEQANAKRVASISALRTQMTKRQAPNALDSVLTELARIGADTCEASLDRSFIDLHQYAPYFPEIDAFQDFPTDRTMPILTTEKLDLTFANGKLTYDHAQPQTLRAEVPLDGPVRCPISRSVTAQFDAGIPLQINASPQGASVTLYDRTPRNVPYRDTVFSGLWSYNANRRGAGAWSWQYAFSGSGQIRGDDYSFSLVVPHAGKVAVSLEKLEEEPM